MKCKICKITKRVNPMFIDGKYINLCPKHALEVRNRSLGYPSNTPFSGKIARELYAQQMKEEGK